jgi:hypothetical protein
MTDVSATAAKGVANAPLVPVAEDAVGRALLGVAGSVFVDGRAYLTTIGGGYKHVAVSHLDATITGDGAYSEV